MSQRGRIRRSWAPCEPRRREQGNHVTSAFSSYFPLLDQNKRRDVSSYLKKLIMFVCLIGLVSIVVFSLSLYQESLKRDNICNSNSKLDPFSAESGECYVEPRYRDIDVVVVAVKPTCVSTFMVEGLNRFMWPRRIVIITPTASRCAKFTRMASNVVCILEDDVIPGISKKVVGDYLESVHEQAGSTVVDGRSFAGWYLQQFLKMGAGRHLSWLSDHFLLWDSDMVPLQHLHWFQANRSKVIFNIGGYVTPTYMKAYEALVPGSKLEFAADRSSFVTHSMMIYKPYMEELLLRFNDGESGNGWIFRIMDVLDKADVHKGFSEYQSYASWVMQNHRESMVILPQRTWSRHPFGGTFGMLMLRASHKNGLCCPSQQMVNFMRLLGNRFSGFEIGHHMCDAMNHKYDDSYGLD